MRPLLAIGVAGVVIAGVVWWAIASGPSAPALVLQHKQLTAASGVEQDATLSPDGKWFLYVSDVAGSLDIYLQSVGGTSALNLTKDSPAAGDHEPSFSPDGERIAFRSGREGGGIFVMGRTGEAPRRLTSEGFDPAWSPDGTQLVYSTVSTALPTDRSTLGALRIVRVDTGAVTKLLEADGLHPAWSADGRFIAYWGMSAGGDDFSRSRDLWVIPAGGGTPWRVTDDPHVDWCPVWSPDGSFLYFVSNRGGSMNVWRLPMDTSGHAAGAPEAVTTPASYVGRIRMSASGGHIVYESRVQTSNVYRSSFDAARAALGPVETVTSGSRAFRYADMSPDGKMLVLGTGYLHQEDLFISRPDGSDLRQLTTDIFNDRFPQWSPDGSVIAFYSNRSGKYEIWTVTPAGLLTQLTDASDYSVLYPRWSPDGLRMTFNDISNRRVAVIFDPRKPWKDQTPDVLPPPAGPGSFMREPRWSPEGTKLAGMVDGALTVYDIASRKYRPVGNIRGPRVYNWLRDGRLFVGPPNAPRIVDPTTGASRLVAVPQFGGPIPQSFELSRDEETAYFNLVTAEGDIWLIGLGGK
jgi:Tol biopolymer transport system component